jgi:hypothetical protein
MLFNSHPSEDARIEKKDGALVGPYKAIFAGDTIILKDAHADVEEGDVVLRRLPNGKDERSEVTSATFFNSGGTFPPHYQLKFRKGPQREVTKPGNTINIHGIHGGQVQIGDHNTQNIVNALRELKDKIDKSDGLPAEKQQAIGLLRNLLAHPLVTSVLSGIAGGIVGS